MTSGPDQLARWAGGAIGERTLTAHWHPPWQCRPGTRDQPDPANAVFGRISRIVGPRDMTGHDWHASSAQWRWGPRCQGTSASCSLSPAAHCFTAGSPFRCSCSARTQLHRVLETAVKTRYAELGGARRRPDFKHATDWLIQCKAVPPRPGTLGGRTAPPPIPSDRVRWLRARCFGRSRKLR